MIYDIHLLQLGFHLVAVVGKPLKNGKETAIYKMRKSTQNNTKTQNTQNGIQEYKTRKAQKEY
jgi:hypothetical protein